VDDAIKDTENSLAAAIQQEHIGQKPLLQEIRMPSLTMDSIKALLEKSLPDLEQEAATEVQSHLQSLGHGAEGWVAEGIKRINPVDQACPFCKQSLSNLEIIKYYRAYFSDAYKKLKSEIDESSALLNRLHGGEARAAFERAVRVLGESQKFWSNFEELPVISFDSVEISRRWRTAFESLVAIMDAKRSNPLEKISLSPEAGLVIRSFEESLNQISEQNKLIAEANAKIEVVKERASSGNMRALEADLAKLKATKIRYREDIQKICDEYQAESTAKSGTEQRRDKIREALNQHQTSIFPAFNTAINDYLRKFNAGFRLSNIAPENTRGGTACTYNVVIYDQSIPIGGSQPRAGQRGFKNTLSSGDRNTLALAFFFAMVDQNPNSKDAIVVIDDPMTSLDDHRTLTTAQEIRALSLRAKQVIVLSHSKPFLCRIWQHAVRTHRTSIQVVRDGTGSTLKAWDVREDSITEYDRKHQLLRDYSANGNNSREVAEALRPVMEGYLRVGCPKYFPPGTLLGPFRGTCEQKVGTTDEILSRNDIDELRNLTEYANKFHHDSNPAWETEAINDGELLGFTERTLNFIKRK
jgi:wobble nucleotide-excising tRNase